MVPTAKINEKAKLDVGLVSQSLATTSGTGSYHSMARHKRALYFFQAAAMAATKTVVAQIMEAKDGIATSAQALTSATATITANTKITKGLFTANTIVDEDSGVDITIYDAEGNAVSTQAYQCEDTDPDATVGEFASGADDDAACVNLAVVINALQGDYVYAVAGTGIVTLNVREPGEYSMTITADDATIVASTLEACGYVEVDAAQMTATFTHLALKLTTTATIICGGMLVREGLQSGGMAPGQVVAASKVL